MQILGYDYKLIKVDEHRKIDAFGRLLHDTLEIQIAANLAPQQLVSTVLHEVIEALNYHLELGLRHEAIMALESGLYQTLTANGIDLNPLAQELEETRSANADLVAATERATRLVPWFFTVECPGCGRLFEIPHLAVEVLHTGLSLGQCPNCECPISISLHRHSTDEAPPASGNGQE